MEEVLSKVYFLKILFRLYSAADKMHVDRNLVQSLSPTNSDFGNSVDKFLDLLAAVANNSTVRVKRSQNQGQSKARNSIVTTGLVNAALFFYHKSVSIATAQDRWVHFITHLLHTMV